MDQESPTAGISPCVLLAPFHTTCGSVDSQPGLAFPPSPQPASHQGARFRLESSWEWTGKLALGAEVVAWLA